MQDERVRIMERQDHEACQAEGASYNPELTREIYWKCRLAEVNRRMRENNSKYGYTLLEKGELKKVKLIMENRVERASNAVLLTLDPDPDVRDNDYCVIQGYSATSIDEKILEAYYNCRRELVIARTVPEPFGKYSYELLEEEARDIPKLRNLKDVILENERTYDNKKDSPIDIKTSVMVAETSELVNKYPTCAVYNVNSAKFKECVKKEEESSNCFELFLSSSLQLIVIYFCNKSIANLMILYSARSKLLNNFRMNWLYMDKQKLLKKEMFLVEKKLKLFQLDQNYPG